MLVDIGQWNICLARGMRLFCSAKVVFTPDSLLILHRYGLNASALCSLSMLVIACGLYLRGWPSCPLKLVCLSQVLHGGGVGVLSNFVHNDGVVDLGIDFVTRMEYHPK